MVRRGCARRLCWLLAYVHAIAGGVSSLAAQQAGGGFDRSHVARAPTHVSASAAAHAHVEPHVAVDRRDPSRVLAAAMVFAPPDYVPRVVAFVSSDSARTWRTTALTPLPATRYPWPGQFDPWTAVGRDGTLFVSAMRIGETGGDVFVWSSRDDGHTWVANGPLSRGGEGSFDHPVLLASTHAAFPGLFLYANQGARTDQRGVFGNSLLYAADGQAFGEPHFILPNNFNNQNGGLAQLSDGSVIATWFEIESRGAPALSQQRLWTTILQPGSTSRGATRLVTPAYDGGWPMIAVDAAQGGKPDRIHIVWTSRSAPSGGQGGRVVTTHSDDAGMTWSPLTSVDDRPARGNPMIAVAPDGAVGVSWLREDGGCLQLHFASSARGAVGISPAQAVSDRWCPDTSNAANRAPIPGGQTVAGRWSTGGDYHGLAAIGGSEFIAVWVDDTRRVYQVHSARVRAAERR